jgi:hypothetical protein
MLPTNKIKSFRNFIFHCTQAVVWVRLNRGKICSKEDEHFPVFSLKKNSNLQLQKKRDSCVLALTELHNLKFPEISIFRGVLAITYVGDVLLLFY